MKRIKLKAEVSILVKQPVNADEENLIALKFEQYLNDNVYSLVVKSRVVDVVPRFHFTKED